MKEKERGPGEMRQEKKNYIPSSYIPSRKIMGFGN